MTCWAAIATIQERSIHGWTGEDSEKYMDSGYFEGRDILTGYSRQLLRGRQER